MSALSYIHKKKMNSTDMPKKKKESIHFNIIPKIEQLYMFEGLGTYLQTRPADDGGGSSAHFHGKDALTHALD